jgi:anti-sigma B factor antagonist
MTEETHGDVRVIVIEGEVDAYTSPRLRDHIVSLIEEREVKLVVKLAKVEYLDSSALTVLIGALKRLSELSGTIVLACATRRINRVFEITRLDKYFDFYPTVEEAVENIRCSEVVPT